jgi:hypothetical protein
MTEIEVRPQFSTTLMEDPTGGRLVAWARAASAANQLARSLCNTSFVPDTVKAVRLPDGSVDPGNATAVIIMGDELGLSPLASLRSIYIFKGTPALYARTMRALALSHGHNMWNESSTDNEVIVCGQRKGSSHVERASWTIARATKAGYTSNPKYRSDPQSMLQAKADSEIARKIAADVLAGVPYSIEDMELEEQSTTTVEAKPRKATVSRAKAEPAPTPEPPLDSPPTAELAAEPEPEPTGEGITAPQMKMLHALFNEKGFKDRDDGLDFIATVIMAQLESSKDLTKDEASRVIDALTALDTPS